MQRKSVRPAASPGIRNSIYVEEDVSCVPENQAIITVLVSITGHEWLHSHVKLCIRVSNTVWRDDFFSSALHCPAACNGIEWLNSTWTVHRNLIPEERCPTEYLNIQGSREQEQEKGVYKTRSKNGRSKTAGNRPQKGVLHSLSPCKKNSQEWLENSLILRDMAIRRLSLS